MKSKLEKIILLIITIHFFQLGCQSNPFNIIDDNVKAVVIKEIKHPLLGAVIRTDTLNIKQTRIFFYLLDNMKEKGVVKLWTNYIIVIKNKDNSVLRLKTNGVLVSFRDSDYYYEFPDNLIKRINNIY